MKRPQEWSLPPLAVRASLCLLATILFTGCAGRVIYHQPSFTLDRLREGRMAVAAVSGVGDNPLVQNALSDDIQKAMSSGTANVEVIPLARVRQLIPADVYDGAVKEVSDKIGLAYRDLKPFAVLGPKARYLIWVHLNEMTSDSRESRHEITETSTHYNETTKQYKTCDEVVGYERSRSKCLSLGIYVWIYDLAEEKFVWVAEGRSGTSNQTRRSGRWHPTPIPEWPSAPGLYPAISRSALVTLRRLQ